MARVDGSPLTNAWNWLQALSPPATGAPTPTLPAPLRTYFDPTLNPSDFEIGEEPTHPLAFAAQMMAYGFDAGLLAGEDETAGASVLSARFVQSAFLDTGVLGDDASTTPVGSGRELFELLSGRGAAQTSLDQAQPNDVVFLGSEEDPHQHAYLYAGKNEQGEHIFVGVEDGSTRLYSGPLDLAGRQVTVLSAREQLSEDGSAESPAESIGEPAVEPVVDPAAGGDAAGYGSGGGSGGSGGSASGAAGTAGASAGPVYQSVSDAILENIINQGLAISQSYLDQIATGAEFDEFCRAKNLDPKSPNAKKAFAMAKLRALDVARSGELNLEALDAKLQADPEAARGELEQLMGTLATSDVDVPSGRGVTLEQLRAIMPNLPASLAQQYLPLLNAAMERFQINTPLRQAAFLAQLAHESVQLKYFEEIGGRNTRYAPYYGRGPIQLTWESNYRAASMAIFGDDRLVRNPELAARPEIGFLTAGWFWQSRNLNSIADQRNFGEVTRRVNGRNHGKADDEYARARSVLGV